MGINLPSPRTSFWCARASNWWSRYWLFNRNL